MIRVEAWERAVAHVATMAAGEPAEPSWRVTVHFHPDRLVNGVPILDRMARDGRYRSQFETGVSNGGLTAHPGGDRWRWESRLFAGAYDKAAPAHRPKYGSLNFRGRKAGGSPRFGSAHLRLARHTMSRTTFSYPDCVFEPTSFGVEAHLSELVALAEADGKDRLDDYIEAQVHGEVDLARDVEALVLDPAYRGTEIEAAARNLGPVEWHEGFQLAVEELLRHPDYRGPKFTALGAELAEEGRLDPRILGKAAGHDEQDLKRVWHLLARFGNQELS